jgi:hypothetical protein
MYIWVQGFPLWTRAEEPGWSSRDDAVSLWEAANPDAHLVKGVFPLRGYHLGLRGCWATMRFCADLGAPLSAQARALLKMVRDRTRAVLRCFHAATRLAEGNEESGPALAAMGAVPLPLVHQILLFAGLEITESIRVRR